jgi:hypothetical protein
MNMIRPLFPKIVEPGNAMATARSAMFVISALLILILAMAGFSDTAAANSPTSLCWIDYPLDGSTLDASTSYQITVHSASSNGMSQTELSINDKVLGTLSNQSGSLAVCTQTWQPGTAGQFTVKARCHDRAGNWSDYATAKVTVTGTGPRLILPGLQPPRIVLPSTGQTGTSFSEMTPSTDHFYYRATGCGPKQVTIRVKVADQSGVANTAIWFRLVDQVSQKATAWTVLPMQLATGGNVSESYWALDLNSENDIPGFSSYTNAWFQFYFKAKNKTGIETNSETYYQRVTLSACAGNLVR